MKSNLRELVVDLKLPYLRALLLIALVPLFPEYISFFLAIGAFLFAWQDIRQRNHKIRLGAIGKLLLVYCSYMTITCFFSTHPLQSAAVSAMWWFFFLVFLILTNLLIDEDRTDTFLMCISGIAGIIGLIACIQYRLNFFFEGTHGSIWDWLDKLVFPLLPFNLTLQEYKIRAYASFANPNMLAQYLVMMAPFVACFNFIERRHDLRLFSRISLFLTFAGILFSFSRGGYLALLVLAIALIIINIRHRFAAVSLYVFSAILFLPEEVVTRLFSIRSGISSSNTIAGSVIGSNSSTPGTTSDIINNAGAEFAISERWEIWFESIKRILERPFFGYGVGTEPTATMFEKIGVDAPHAHNIILQLLLEGGIFALILMCFIGLITIKNGWSLMRHGYSSAFWMGFAVLGFATGLLVHGMVDYPLTTPRLICTFITALAIAEQSILLYPNRNKTTTKKERFE